MRAGASFARQRPALAPRRAGAEHVPRAVLRSTGMADHESPFDSSCSQCRTTSTALAISRKRIHPLRWQQRPKSTDGAARPPLRPGPSVRQGGLSGRRGGRLLSSPGPSRARDCIGDEVITRAAVNGTNTPPRIRSRPPRRWLGRRRRSHAKAEPRRVSAVRFSSPRASTNRRTADFARQAWLLHQHGSSFVLASGRG